VKASIWVLFAAIVSSGLVVRAQDPDIAWSQLAPIDAHTHVFSSAPALYEMLQKLDLRILDICVLDRYRRGFNDAKAQQSTGLEVFRASRGRAAWCSTFDPEDWESPGFSRHVIADLEKTFDEGAVCVKIWKSIGLDLKSRQGAYLMPDNPVFDPILDAIAAHNKTLFAHLAEPSEAWRPLDPSSVYYEYYKANPDWHLYLHPERPSKESILAARDRMLQRHPNLRVVGCHLGSMEEDVDEIAKRLDLYPNFAVDTAARVENLMRQPRDKVRAFLIKYQDRVLYGTDLDLMPWDDAGQVVKHWESIYERDWNYFAKNGTYEHGKRTFQGLGLPEPVLRKLYHENARRWVPGLFGSNITQNRRQKDRY
jgi:predicted TIM-barrel fold metal-dependent hydrolase